MRKKNSTGKAGEKLAEFHFNKIGWKMFRTQPVTRIAFIKNKRETIQARDKSGIADYTGYRVVDGIPIYTACEVKEQTEGLKMPCSRLGKEQRKFMLSLPESSRFVGIYWAEKDIFKVYYFKEAGSYEFREAQ
jgi:hypothetical protein